jgi:hypothetical protein
MKDRLGKVVHVENGYTVVEILEDGPGGPAVVGYSLFGRGTDIRKVYSRDAAVDALRQRLALAG